MAPMSGADRAEDVIEHPPTGDPFTVLAQLPKDAQLLLRDYIAGLEAEAGAARAAAARQERLRKAATERLVLLLAGARAERDKAIAQRDSSLLRRVNRLASIALSRPTT
jgi:hypothetical protein